MSPRLLIGNEMQSARLAAFAHESPIAWRSIADIGREGGEMQGAWCRGAGALQ